MNGATLDSQMRIILSRATMHTIFADTRALMALGFGAYQSFSLLEGCILQRGRQQYEARLRVDEPGTTATRLHDWRHSGEAWHEVARAMHAPRSGGSQ